LFNEYEIIGVECDADFDFDVDVVEVDDVVQVVETAT
jgi:hypothetical protein